ncbi:restriction endonuclease subunit S [Acinetobacter sp. YH12120]|uniref:restriction endonuclease subunit S n=1 Tax=Acinetobacter sp. YH12120 TaxID=2601107 RepID=UPI0015D14D4E|nr:restriction endonuclease subunit S [Acinetobacter sp. YH12120]
MFEKYDAYKDSGLESFPEIPKNWQLKKLKFLLDEVNIRSETGDETLLSLSKYKGVIPKDSLDERAGSASTLVGYKKVFKHNLVINKMQAVNGLLAVSELEGITSPDYSVYSAKDNSVNIHYIAFLLNQPEYLAEMKKRVTGVMEGFIRLYTDDLYDIKAILPSIKEQNCIVDFLQKKLVEIDQAIAIKEQQIALLNERKQIVIQKAVTQGLEPNVPMKNSGVEWIGQIPEHWELKKIKHVTSKIGSGVTPSGGGATYLDEGIPLLRSQNIHFDRIDLNDVARISEKVHHSMSNSKVRKNDVLLNITGGSIGRCYFVETSEEMNVNQHVCILRPKKNITSIFLNAVLASEVGQGQIWYFQQGGGREGLNFQALKNFDIALPPIEEQILISKKVEEIYQQFGNMNAHIQMQIEKLKEYKTTLINDAVTGKIKVA